MNIHHIIRTIKFLFLALLISLPMFGCGSGGGDRAGLDKLNGFAASGLVNGEIQQGVTINLSGNTKASVNTDANGNYNVSGLSNGKYTVTPEKQDYAFSPSSTVITVSGANVSGTKFTSKKIKTYVLFGIVKGVATKDVLITLDDAGKSNTLTNAKGEYSFTNLPNGTYTANASLFGYNFSPATQTSTIRDDNATLGNFESTVATQSPNNISGKVSGAITQGVAINLTGTATASTTTDATGFYSFNNVADGSYTITPVKAGYTFSPTSTSASVTGASVSNTNFTASSSGVSTYTLSGTVTGAVLANVAITLNDAGKSTTVTNASGNYSFPSIPNGTYTATPSLQGYTFSPSAVSITLKDAPATFPNISATVVPSATYTLTGSVSGATGVSITLTGGASTLTTTTDGNGNYGFANLAGGIYTVTPAKAGYTFNPSSTTANLSTGNLNISNGTLTLAAFVGKPDPAPTYTLSGTVTGDITQSVNISLGGGVTGSTTTNASGNYNFTGLANGTYTITPSLTGYTFSPKNSQVTVNGANLTVGNFVATIIPAPTYTLSGNVTGAVTQGVTVTLSGGGINGSTTTNNNGAYSFTGLANGSYTVTPSRAGYTFNPGNAQATINNANLTLANFAASANTYTISGLVGGATAQGVSINLTGAATLISTTDANGYYQFTGLSNGSYTVSPSKSGYTFDKNSIAVTVSSANVSQQNFTASVYIPPTYTLSGTVTGSVLNGVKITLSGASNAITTTNANGAYSFTGMPNGNYTATPSLNGYTFSPTSASATINNANSAFGNFVSAATLVTITINQAAGGGLIAPGSIMVGYTKQFESFGTLSDGSNTYANTMAWYSSNSSVATVNSATGLVTAVNPGTANITAKSGNVTSNSAVIVVNKNRLMGGTIQGTALTLSTAVSTLLSARGQTYSVTTDGTDLFISEGQNIYKLAKTSTGAITMQYQGANGAPGFAYALTSDGKNLFVAAGTLIRKIDISSGVETVLAGSGVSGYADGTGAAALFTNVEGITTDGINVYVADTFNNRIRKININTGIVTTFAGTGTAGSADNNNGLLASFNYPTGLTTDGVNLYLADENSNAVRQIVISSGAVTTLAGGTQGKTDGVGINAKLYLPLGITTDGIYLYITEYSNTIRKIELSSKLVTTIAGNGTAGTVDATIGTSASFQYPVGLTTDGISLYVGDANNNKIRTIQ